MWFLLVLVVILLCAYVGWRSAQALFSNRKLRWGWFFLILLTSSGFFLGLPLRGTPLGVGLRIMGTTWMLTLPYWLLAVFFFDALRLLDKRRAILPVWVKNNYAAAKRLAFLGTVGAVTAIFLYGYWRFDNPVTTPVAVVIGKDGSGRAGLHAVVAADWHLGDLIGRERTARYVAKINALNPDIILLPGDIVDHRLETLVAGGMGEELAKLRAPLGVFAVLGNHERYAGAGDCAAYLEQHGIRVLRDEVLLIDNSFYLAGRNDVDQRNQSARAGMVDLLAGTDRAKPVIVLDHQPVRLDEPALAGVDLQLSGHTHNGQVWPVNWIVAFLYDVPYGLGRRDNMQIYVSSGLGLWGFPARIGTVSEIVDLRVEFRGKQP